MTRMLTTSLAALCLAAGLARGDDLAALSTGFDDAAALADWSEHAPEGFTPKWQAPRVEDGILVLEPISGGWFEELHGGHLYRGVEGDFIVTARLRVTGTEAELPQTLLDRKSVV